jgi:hypothetical protein
MLFAHLLLGRVPHRVHLDVATHEFYQPAPACALQPRPYRAESGNFVNLDRLADTFNPGRPQALENKEAFAQFF